jgi:hypothetical protein
MMKNVSDLQVVSSYIFVSTSLHILRCCRCHRGYAQKTWYSSQLLKSWKNQRRGSRKGTSTFARRPHSATADFPRPPRPSLYLHRHQMSTVTRNGFAIDGTETRFIIRPSSIPPQLEIVDSDTFVSKVFLVVSPVTTVVTGDTNKEDFTNV